MTASTTIRVVAYDPRWPAAFDTEAVRIRAALGTTALRLHHIGSTAVPALAAKPVIDMLLEATSLQALDDTSPQLLALGYEALGEFGIAHRRYFRRDDATGTRTHQLHAFAHGSVDVARHVAFRDYLLAHPQTASEYGALKRRLADAHPRDQGGYIAGKDAFVKEHERLALLWVAGHDPTMHVSPPHSA